MGFGDWELFRMVIVSLRETELSSFVTHEEGPRSVRFTVGSEQVARKGENYANDNFLFYYYHFFSSKLMVFYNEISGKPLIPESLPQSVSSRAPVIVEKEKSTSRTDGPSRRDSSKQSIMEKQVRHRRVKFGKNFAIN